MTPGARHLVRKTPRKTRGFSWSRLPDDQAVTYRLTRADVRGRLYAEQRRFPRDCSRGVIARVVLNARHRLRDTVDEISLRQLGVIEGETA